ncbi:MAG: DNA repair protein RecO [Tepidisphaerales bacterium]
MGSKLVHDEAVCLRWWDVSNTSQILLLLTRSHGLVRGVAKGARRTSRAGASVFSGGVDLLDLGTVEMRYAADRELSDVTAWTLTDGHLALRLDLRRAYLALFLGELITRVLAEHDPHPAVFDDFTETLACLCRDDNEVFALVMALRLLKAAGILPELGRCGACGAQVVRDEAVPPPKVTFRLAAASVLCTCCDKGVRDGIGIEGVLMRLAYRLVRTATGADGAAVGGEGGGGRVPMARLRLPRLMYVQTQPLLRLLSQHVGYQLGHRSRVEWGLLSTGRLDLYRVPPPRPHEPKLPELPPRPPDVPPQDKVSDALATPGARLAVAKPAPQSKRRKVKEDLSDTVRSPQGPANPADPQPATVTAHVATTTAPAGAVTTTRDDPNPAAPKAVVQNATG